MALGGPRSDWGSASQILGRLPSNTVARLVGAQYYFIHHYHPACLLGHIAALEGYPARRSVIDDSWRRSGYPQAAFRTLYKHAELDPNHNEELDRFFDRLPLSAHEAAIVITGLGTIELCAASLEEVLRWNRCDAIYCKSSPGHVLPSESYAVSLR
ncbi:hypothetical protein [Sorangium sp. So ce117]|uniref:hypothetical protein n=1 Tax=Sorangium sp. So ce117 TaxID=3133277 RepID=UPI003F62C236